MAITDKQTRGSHAVRAAILLTAAALVAVAINAAIATLGVAWGAPRDYGPLSLPAQASFTVAGVVIGWIGWRMISRRARDPRRLLWILVPLVTVLSLIPDVLLLIAPVIPGTNPRAVVSLMLMHLVVVGCAVPAYLLANRAGADVSAAGSRRAIR